MSRKSNTTETGNVFSEAECLEILAQCALLEQSIRVLREKALTDLCGAAIHPDLIVETIN
jgi:hypothetical protein